MDAKTPCPAEFVQRFWQRTWPEAFRDLGRAGIELQTTDATGDVRPTAGGRPIFSGLRRGAINLILTDHIPMYWDDGRALAGTSTVYESYHLCVIALRFAHPHRAPFFSVNTCVHELLHVLLQDIFVTHPKWREANEREGRIDWLATRLWLFHSGDSIRQSAKAYLDRLRSSAQTV